MGLLQKLIVKLLKGNWGRIVPGVFKAAAEGGLGPQVKAVYWFLAGKKTITGAALIGIGYGLEAICNANPEFQWGCQYSQIVMRVGEVLSLVGLVDGGTRAPWPSTPAGDKPWK